MLIKVIIALVNHATRAMQTFRSNFLFLLLFLFFLNNLWYWEWIGWDHISSSSSCTHLREPRSLNLRVLINKPELSAFINHCPNAASCPSRKHLLEESHVHLLSRHYYLFNNVLLILSPVCPCTLLRFRLWSTQISMSRVGFGLFQLQGLYLLGSLCLVDLSGLFRLLRKQFWKCRERGNVTHPWNVTCKLINVLYKVRNQLLNLLRRRLLI